ncbi:hypothetical protein QAD02_016165 [Eretmocerus hayati]|uniref:Uncharacterized protein n=1 Tax=Eretmocerus hayati TaxID=131215 RepID=A0ACC2PAB9_9HYME|nr:hypothetical protein QAD02_016165 [Eretmocerus hayati]
MQALENLVDGGGSSGQYISTWDAIRNEGYPVEAHDVMTIDGYSLSMYRIPGKKGSPPVFIQHGLTSSSLDWLKSKGYWKALPFKLHDEGYDVWLGNSRGNMYSRYHRTFRPTDEPFWDFSWYEMGRYDLPAELEFIKERTGKNIIYIGHSMGTTMFYVMAIEKPWAASMVKVMFSFAPIAFLSNIASPFKLLAANDDILEMLPNRMFTQMNAGTSKKTVAHYAQEINSGKFANYDYGWQKNYQMYGRSTPPDFDLSKIKTPIGLFWSRGDTVSSPRDVRNLYNSLPNVILNYEIPDGNFQHTDFSRPDRATLSVYHKLLSAMADYNHHP